MNNLMDTGAMLKYMCARAHGNVIDAPADDAVLLQAARDGYADWVDGQWIARGEWQAGERRLVRFSAYAGGGTKVLQ